MKRSVTFICGILLLAFVISAYAADSPVPPKTPGSDGRVTMKFKDVPLAEALKQVLGSQRVNHVVAPLPNSLTVTLVLQDVTLKTAMDALAKAAGLTYQVVDGIYYIAAQRVAADEATEAQLVTQLADRHEKLVTLLKTKSEADREVMAARGGLSEIESKLCQLWLRTASIQTWQIEQKPAEKPISEVFQLRFLRPVEIAPIIQTTSGVKSVTTVGTNKLLITGTQSANEVVRNVILKLDDQAAIPQPARVKVELLVISVSSDGKSFPCSVASEAVGIMGSETCLNLSVAPYDEKKSGPRGELSAKLTPYTSPNGKINLKVSGSFRCVFDNQVATREYDVTTLTDPGKASAVISDSSQVDGKTLNFQVLVTVTPEDGNQKSALAKS